MYHVREYDVYLRTRAHTPPTRTHAGTIRLPESGFHESGSMSLGFDLDSFQLKFKKKKKKGADYYIPPDSVTSWATEEWEKQSTHDTDSYVNITTPWESTDIEALFPSLTL